MGLIVDKTQDNELYDGAVAQGVCIYCGNNIQVHTSKYEDICPHCGNTYTIQDVLSDSSIDIHLDKLDWGGHMPPSPCFLRGVFFILSSHFGPYHHI